jgi:hypothetical protein
MKLKTSEAAVVAFLSISPAAWAQNTQTDVRDYEGLVYAPSNTVTATAYARQISSSDSANFTETTGTIRTNYLFKSGNLGFVPIDLLFTAADQTVYLPMAAGSPISGSTINTSGIYDLTYLPTIGYYVTEDEKSETHTYFAATVYVTAPTGNYDTAKPVNFGENRWRVQPLLTVGQRFAKAFTFEVNGSAAIYTSNTKYVTGMGLATMKQDPTFGFEAHLGADLGPTFFAGVSYYLAADGQRTLDESGAPVVQKAQTTQTMRFTYGIKIEKFSTLLLQYNQDIEASGGATISRFLGARFSHSMFL